MSDRPLFAAPEEVCLLVPVYHPYRWVVPHVGALLDEFWPGHPPVYFAGLEPGEAPGLTCTDLTGRELPRDWAAFSLEAVEQLLRRGFRKAYFIGEDHVPVAPCHVAHLNRTIPEEMDRLGASYIGLMGWDNRRFLPRGELVSGSLPGLRRLRGPHAPRFHLHPALFRLETLRNCLAYVMSGENHTPWAFEKRCDKEGAALPDADKAGCYQIFGEALGTGSVSPLRSIGQAVGRWFFHRAMALAPAARKLGFGMAYWDAFGFDDFFYRGPYPMFYSGVMSRGRLNPFFLKFLEPRAASSPGLACLLEEARTLAGVDFRKR